MVARGQAPRRACYSALSTVITGRRPALRADQPVVGRVVSDEPDPTAAARVRRASLCLRFAADLLALPDAGDALDAAAAAVLLAQSDLYPPAALAPWLCGLSDTGQPAPHPRA